MNGFKKFLDYHGKPINYKILFNNILDDSVIELSLSYFENIWSDGERDEVNNFHKRFYLHRDEWLQKQGYENVQDVIRDFNEAVNEFDQSQSPTDLKNKVNLFFLAEAKKVIALLP